MFGADLVYHHACLSAYIQKYKRAISVKESGPIRFTKKKIFECYINFIRDVIESGSGISLNDIRDMINDKETIFISNSEVKIYLTETFGSEIQFAISERKNESHMVSSSSVSNDDVNKRLRPIDSTKLAAKKIRDIFLAMDFNLQDKFCDVEELRNSWEPFCTPDELITLFGTLFNINYATLTPNFPKSNNLEDDDDVEEMLFK